MPIEESTVLNVVCDNANCPGNQLDPTTKDGWLIINHEVYGDPVMENVFCSYTCLGEAANNAPVIAPATTTNLVN